jgi:hypothetical protein
MTNASDLEPKTAKLGYFRDIRERRAWMARVTVIVALVGLLGLNTYLLFISSKAVIMNVDLARWEQSEMHDSLSTRLIRVELELEELRATMETPDLAGK